MTNGVEKQREDVTPNAAPEQPRGLRPKTSKFPNKPQGTLLLCGTRDMTPIREKTSARSSRRKKELANQTAPASELLQESQNPDGSDEPEKSWKANGED